MTEQNLGLLDAAKLALNLVLFANDGAFKNGNTHPDYGGVDEGEHLTAMCVARIEEAIKQAETRRSKMSKYNLLMIICVNCKLTFYVDDNDAENRSDPPLIDEESDIATPLFCPRCRAENPKAEYNIEFDDFV